VKDEREARRGTVFNMIISTLSFADQSVQKAVFGCPLESHLQHIGSDVSFVIEQCVGALLQYGISEEV
jgi:GTP-sensing pleiotropic transcriptional regulator CodY